ncbi:hypothetical protein [Hyphomicrobium sp.]|uniref:hypothetical protein n=1 Tax=Hyphomicrobium sp. TaxID=82 RepID=UPI002E340056|nr:hypothetical protein [Hyphomicrobium sp.]HEX2839993.1 hypothetical protein [Hyphomicrobium sp.]
MIDATSEAESDLRLPAAYSQGFAHVRVVTLVNADDPGPLTVPGEKRNAIDAPLENAIGPALENRRGR